MGVGKALDNLGEGAEEEVGLEEARIRSEIDAASYREQKRQQQRAQ